MRKFYMMLFVALFLTVTMWGRQRAINEAESIAQTALRNTAASKGRSIKSGSVSMRTIRSSQILKRQKVTQEHEAFFLCKHEGEGAGFVVVSADDRMPEVLAVSDDGSFDENNVPENMQVMLQDYAEALEQIERGEATMESIFYPKSESEVTVEPLLGGIKYNQGKPYNAKCPIRPSTNTSPAAGCVAVAMAQTMRYHKWPEDYGTGSVSYTSKVDKDIMAVSWDFSKLKFNWVNIMETYSKKGTEYAGGEEKTTADSMKYYALHFQYLSSGYNIKVDSLVMVNQEKNFTGTVQFVLADDKGNFLQPIGEGKTLPNQKFGQNTRVLIFTFSMPGTYPDGNYRFYLASKEKNTNVWSYIRKVPDFTMWYDEDTYVDSYFPVVKKGDRYFINGNEYTCEYTDTAADAVAELIAACGASVKMQYSSSSSASTIDIATSAVKYFGYDKDALYIGQSYMTTNGWHKRLQEELVAARPVIYRGTNDSGGGHAFVLDGVKFVNGVPYYHVNWGWGGSSNGDFLLTLLKPSEAGTGGSSSNYAHSNAMILNLQKDDGISGSHLGCKSGMSVDTTYVMPGDKISATVNSMINLGATAFSGKMNMCLISEDGTRYNMGTCYSTTGLSTNYYFTSSKTIEYTIPKTMPFGDYTLTMYGIPTDGSPCEVFNAYEITIHVVPEDPSKAMEGMLRYDFDNSENVAKVRRFCQQTSYNATRYYGDIVVPDTVEFKGVKYEVTAVGDSAFFGCDNVTSVIMSDHVKRVGAHAFDGCTALTEVQYPKDFKGNVAEYTFNGCTALESLTLPDSITSIETFAFAANGLKSLTVPEGVTSIATKAFYENKSLKEVVLPEGLTSVAIYAFRYCEALEKINIPSTWTRIINYTFQGCSSLKSIEIPATVTNIGSNAFKDCSAMESIKVYNLTPPTLGTKAFDNTNNCPIYVDSGVVDAYKSAWSAYSSRIVGGLVGIKHVAVTLDNKEDDAFISLDGIRVTTPVKGKIYLKNGKKILVR